MALYDEHADLREHFEILAFHDDRAKTFEELDAKMEVVREKYWEGRSLPFPILLDATGKTLEVYGISAFPTNVLLDPDGNVVKCSPEKRLKEVLEGLAEKSGG